MKYKPLAKEIKKKGMYYKEHYREKDFAIYMAGNSNSAFLGYEVFDVLKHDGYVIAGNKVEAAEMFPSDEAFGVSAFFVKDSKKRGIKVTTIKGFEKIARYS